MNELFETLFCPVHGLLRPANWLLVMPAISGGIVYGRRAICWLCGKRSNR